MAAFGKLFALVRATIFLGAVAATVYFAQPLIARFGAPAVIAPPVATATPAAAVKLPVQVRADGTLTLSLTDADLTRLAEPYFPQSILGVTVSDPKVSVTGGRVLLGATAKSFFGNGPLVARAAPSAGDGRLLVRVESVTLGGATLPDGIRGAISDQLQSALDASLAQRIRVTSVTTSDGVLTLSGRPAS